MKFFKTPITVDAALANLSKAVADLKTAADHHQDEADFALAQSNELLAKASVHAENASKARRAAGKIADLIA